MAVSSLLERVAAALFGGRESPADDEQERQLIDDMIEIVVDAVEPRIRAHGRYREKLEGCIRHTLAHLRALAREGLDPVLLTRAAWSTDPRVNAFFATANDVTECLGRSIELRAFFESTSALDVEEAYALLGMRKQERKVLAPRLEGDTVKQEVAQMTVSFSDHRLVAPAATLAEARREIGLRVIQRLAHVALSGVAALDAKATELEGRKASLGMRLRMLKLARDGMEGVVNDPAAAAQQIRALEGELKETTDDYLQTKASLATLDVYLTHIGEVFSHPERHITLTHTPLRVDRMGFKVDETSSGPANELSLTELSIGDNLQGAIVIARCPRSELPPKGDLIARAERYL